MDRLLEPHRQEHGYGGRGHQALCFPLDKVILQDSVQSEWTPSLHLQADR